MSNVVSIGGNLPGLIPERLREARESRELTMEAVGALVGVTRQAISFYESGDRIPDGETLLRLSEKLGQPIIFFTSDRPAQFGRRSAVFFRSFRSKTKRTNRKCQILSEWFTQISTYLGQFVNFPEIDFPEIAPPRTGGRYTFDEIEDAASQCRRHWGLGDGPIANVVALLESKGVIVARSEFGVDTVDAFSFWEGARAFIFLGADRGSACRSRFDAAHELGHLVLHRGIDEEELEADLKQIEREADRFASAFVLPSTTYPLEIFSTRLSAFKELKRRWKVSIAAQIYRCSDLMLLSEEQVLNLRKQLSANRWRKTEPLDDEILLEQPRVLEKSLELVLGHTAQRPEDILLAVRLSRETVEALLGAQLPGSPEPPDPRPTVRLKII